MYCMTGTPACPPCKAAAAAAAAAAAGGGGGDPAALAKAAAAEAATTMWDGVVEPAKTTIPSFMQKKKAKTGPADAAPATGARASAGASAGAGAAVVTGAPELIIQEQRVEISPPMGAHVAAFDEANGTGLKFAAIVAGSNAEAAGLLPNDQVLSVNGIPVMQERHVEVLAILQSQPPGTRVLVIAREVALAPLAPNQRRVVLNKVPGRSLGIQLMPADADGNGLRVFALTDEGTAKPSGLLKGDAIVAIATVAIGNIPYDDAIRMLTTQPGASIDLVCAADETPLPTKPDDLEPEVVAMEYTVVRVSGDVEEETLLAIDGSTGLGLQLGQYSADGTGLVVLHVDSAGVAGKAGVIKVGDVVLNVNGTNLLPLPAVSAVQVLAVAAATGSATLRVKHTQAFGFGV